MSQRTMFAAVAYLCSVTAVSLCNAQHSQTSVTSDDDLKTARFKGVKTFHVFFIGAWDYPDRDRLERFAKAEARRLLPGVAYKASHTEAESAQAFAEGSHLDIYVNIQLAWSPDATRDCTAANVRTIFAVGKRGAVDKFFPPAGQLRDVGRTEANTVIGVRRRQLTESTEGGITRNFEVLANGFFESR